MKKTLMLLPFFIFITSTGCKTDSNDLHNLIKSNYEGKQFTTGTGLLATDYKPIEFSQIMSFSKIDGYYFNIEPNQYVVHTYECSIKIPDLKYGYIGGSKTENVLQTDTIYLHKKSDNTYEICQKYSMFKR